MIQFGSFLALLGVSSIVLSFVDEHSMTLLSWIDNWGNTTAWAIRLTLTAVGVACIAFDLQRKKKGSPKESENLPRIFSR